MVQTLRKQMLTLMMPQRWFDDIETVKKVQALMQKILAYGELTRKKRAIQIYKDPTINRKKAAIEMAEKGFTTTAIVLELDLSYYETKTFLGEYQQKEREQKAKKVLKLHKGGMPLYKIVKAMHMDFYDIKKIIEGVGE